MRIAIDGRCLAGPVLEEQARYTLMLLKHIARSRVSVCLFYRASKAVPSSLLDDFDVTPVPLDDFGGAYWEQVSVPQALRRGSFDLHHIPMREANAPVSSPCPVVMTFDRCARQCIGRAPSTKATTARNSFAGPLSRLYRNLRYGAVENFITPSECCRRRIISILELAPDRVTTIPFFESEESCEPCAAEPRVDAISQRFGVRPPYLISADGCEEEDELKVLLAAFAVARHAVPDLKLVVVGQRMPSVHLLEHALNLGLRLEEDAVFLLDVGSEWRALFDGAELGLSTATDSTCQPWVIRALTRGLQVVSVSAGGAAEGVGCAGKSVECLEPGAIADAIKLLLQSSSRAQREAAARQQAARFTWKATADATMALYQSMLRNDRYASDCKQRMVTY